MISCTVGAIGGLLLTWYRAKKNQNKLDNLEEDMQQLEADINDIDEEVGEVDLHQDPDFAKLLQKVEDLKEDFGSLHEDLKKILHD